MPEGRNSGRRRGMAGLAAALVASVSGLAIPGTGYADPPRRVMSIEVCANQYVLALADREQIISLSKGADESRLSFLYERAKGIPMNRRTAEEVILAQPDLLFSGYWSRRTTAFLKRFGFNVMTIKPPRNLAQVKEQITEVARALGHEKRGWALVADIERQEAIARKSAGTRRPLGAVYRAGGYSYGADTLVDSIMNAAGIENVSAKLGYRLGGQIPLEILLTGRPEVLLDDRSQLGRPRVATDLLDHPAIRRGLPKAKRIEFPIAYWICGGASVPTAIHSLAKAVATRLDDGKYPQ